MGGVLSLISEKCKKLSSCLKSDNESSSKLDYPTCSTRTTEMTDIYMPPKKYQTSKTIITCENFKDYLSSTCVSRRSNELNDSENNINYLYLKNKFSSNGRAPQSRNIQNLNYLNLNTKNYITNSANNITHLINNPSYNTFPYPEYKHRYKNSFSRDNYTKKENLEKICLDHFIILKQLGRGTFGKVLLVRYKKDSKLYAMKVLKKYRLFKTNQVYHTKTEREILEKINHPFIVKLHFAFQTDEKLYLVTEFMQGGELFFHLKKEKIFNEEKVKAYVTEIILAIEHLHKNNIIYRDLKPENILLDIDGHIKLTDFGLSKFFTKSMSLSQSNSLNNQYENDNSSSRSNCSDKAFTLCGTPEYLAPEILMGKGYDKSVDWWSLGVLIHEMLIGSSPFKSRRERLDLSYYTPVTISKKISEDAKDLILNLLKQEPEERLSDSLEIKSHVFFKEVNWDNVELKQNGPQFVPKIYLKNEEDVCLFDINFTMASLSDDEKKISNSTESKRIDKNKIKKNRDNFENFSFIRENVNEGVELKL